MTNNETLYWWQQQLCYWYHVDSAGPQVRMQSICHSKVFLFKHSWLCPFFTGLNAGDEILQLNGKDSDSLNFSDMKAAFSQASLTLTVNTLPAVDRRQLCYLPPRRSDKEEDLYTDIFSQSQGRPPFQIHHPTPRQPDAVVGGHFITSKA